MARKKVLIVVPNLGGGGAERVILNLSNRLVTECAVIIGGIQLDGVLFADLDLRIQIRPLDGKFIWPLRLLWLVWKERPDTIFCAAWDVNFITLLLRGFFPLKTRLVIREAIDPGIATSNRWWYKPLLPLYSRLCRRATKIVVMTQSMRRQLAEYLHIPLEKVYVIHNAPALSPGSITRIINRPLQALPITCRIIGVGRLVEQKGFEELIRAFAMLRSAGHPVSLTIAGEGPLRARLEQIIRELDLSGAATLRGYIDDLSDFYDSADLFVLASHFEGHSNAMMEALTAGVPVLASRDRTSADEFLSEGIDGVLIPTCSVENLHKGLLRALSILPSLNRESIARRAQEKFSFERHVQLYREVLFGD